MGGQAFAGAGPNGTALKVPRMPPDIYHRQCAENQTKLERIFRNVTVPRDAPGKADYGDIDFLVEDALGTWTPDSLQKALGASYRVNHGGTHSFAVPYAEKTDEYVQVDVEISPGNGTPDGAELFEWTRFMKSDADLTQIVGITHRPLGLTCNDRGLHVRIKEIEPYNKKKSLLFLTRDVNKMLEFYGFNQEKYRGGFIDEEDLFEWIAKGRFFNRKIFDVREDKNNDRARMRKRPMYSRFVEEYMPSRKEVGTPEKVWTREEVLEEALAIFDKRAEYDVLMAEHNLYEHDNAIWQRIKELIPLEGKPLATTLKGLKHWVDFKDGQPYIAAEPMTNSQPVWAIAVVDEDAVMAWVEKNWQTAKSLEKKRGNSAKDAGKAKKVKMTTDA